MGFQRSDIIQQYAAIMEYGKCSVRSTSAIQFSINDVKEALRAEWLLTQLREDKDAAWKSEYQDVLEANYLHLAIFVPQEDYEAVDLFETIGQEIEKESVTDVKRQEHAKTLVALTPKYTKIKSDVAARMEALNNELQELKNAQKMAGSLSQSKASVAKRPWWKIW